MPSPVKAKAAKAKAKAAKAKAKAKGKAKAPVEGGRIGTTNPRTGMPYKRDEYLPNGSPKRPRTVAAVGGGVPGEQKDSKALAILKGQLTGLQEEHAKLKEYMDELKSKHLRLKLKLESAKERAKTSGVQGQMTGAVHAQQMYQAGIQAGFQMAKGNLPSAMGGMGLNRMESPSMMSESRDSLGRKQRKRPRGHSGTSSSAAAAPAQSENGSESGDGSGSESSAQGSEGQVSTNL